MAVGVVGRVGLEVGCENGAAVSAFEQRSVDDAGIGGERHALGEPVDEDTGDERAFGVLRDLLLDERSEGDGRGDVGDRVSCEAELGGDLAEAMNHCSEHLGGRGSAGEAVGVGEEVAFERRGVRAEVGDERSLRAFGGEKGFARTEAGGLDGLGDIEDVIALGDGDGEGIDVAARDARVDLGGGRRVVEAVLAGDELAAFDGAEEVEREAAADGACVLKLGCDEARTGARSDVDVGGCVVRCAGRRADGNEEEVAGDSGDEEREEEEGCEELQAGFSSLLRRACLAGRW
jgi:hypothetical protein